MLTSFKVRTHDGRIFYITANDKGDAFARLDVEGVARTEVKSIRRDSTQPTLWAYGIAA